MNILVVEDNVFQRLLYERLMAELGVDVTPVAQTRLWP